MGQGIGGLEDWGIREQAAALERVRCQRVARALTERAEASKSGTGQQKVDGHQRSQDFFRVGISGVGHCAPMPATQPRRRLGEESPTREITENSIS